MSKATDIAWVAGLFDGEGCLHISRQRAAQRTDLKTDSFRLYAQVTMGDRHTLERCLEITQLGTIQNHTPNNKKANQAFCWMCSTRDAEKLLKLISRYMITKREESQVALSFCNLAKGWLGGSGGNQIKSELLVNKAITHYWKLRMLKPRWKFYKTKLKKWQRDEIKKLKIQ